MLSVYRYRSFSTEWIGVGVEWRKKIYAPVPPPPPHHQPHSNSSLISDSKPHPDEIIVMHHSHTCPWYRTVQVWLMRTGSSVFIKVKCLQELIRGEARNSLFKVLSGSLLFVECIQIETYTVVPFPYISLVQTKRIFLFILSRYTLYTYIL